MSQTPAGMTPTMPSLHTRVLTAAWIKDVAHTRDTDLRAHRVALTYHHFARELDLCINKEQSVWSCIDDQRNPATSNANWFNFGTWAAVTLNRDLGLRRTPSGSDRLVFLPLRRSLTPIVLHLRAADGQRVSRALSWAQRVVFASTTLTLLNRWSEPPGGGIRTWDAAADKTRTFAAIEHLASWDGMRYLDPQRHLQVVWDAFDAYKRAADYAAQLYALVPGDRLRPRLKANWARNIFAANLMITAVEQDVVNQAVGEAINHLPELLSSAVTGRMARLAERHLGVPRELTALDFPVQIEPLSTVLTAGWARIMTEQILVLLLPNETLRLGKDVPPRSTIAPFFPTDLGDLTALPASGNPGPPNQSERDENARNTSLRDLVDSFDRSRGDGHGSAARDWRRYDERMNWAVNMLRSRQQELSLFWCPFSEEDQVRIVDGALPQRGGDPSSYEVEAPVRGLDPLTEDQKRLPPIRSDKIYG